MPTHGLRKLQIWLRVGVAVGIGCAAACALVSPARAKKSTFRSYGVDQGLASLAGSCMTQDRAGYLFVCTEHGVFTYDGRRFLNLGEDQGLRQGGFVYAIAVTSSGRIAVEYANELFVSDEPSDTAHPPDSLRFTAVRIPRVAYYDERPHRIARWRDGLVLLAGGTAMKVTVPEVGPGRFETMAYGPGERSTLAGAAAVFEIDGILWEAFADGRLCAADPGAVSCYANPDRAHADQWMDVTGSGDGRVLARSMTSVATLEPGTGRWSVAELPGQGGSYLNYRSRLGLFRTPDGRLMTQADDGIDVLGPSGWTTVSVAKGAPQGTILSALTDSTGELWLQVFGHGLVRWVGYGGWEALQRDDGLSAEVAWETVRVPGGSLWVSTDTGIDEVARTGSDLRVIRVAAGSSFALAIGPGGRLWSSYGLQGARVIDPTNGSARRFDVPPVNAIVPDGKGSMWIGTEEGLFLADGRVGRDLGPISMGSPRAPIPDLTSDGAGGVWYLSGGCLRHRHAGGSDEAIAGPWPGGGFQPLSMALDHGGDLWIGGPGGLFRFTVVGDRITSYEAVPTQYTRTNTVVAVMVDHRGWMWVGTALGISVFDGRRWASADTDSGLVSDDVSQGGLREDPDGSIWITTTQGISHLLDPRHLFRQEPLQVVISSAAIGSAQVSGRRMPYTVDALSVQFGTPNYGVERSVIFHYRLSGVDTDWVTSTNGVVRYPFVPPGRHTLSVVAYDVLSHRTSATNSIAFDMGPPWWRSLEAEIGWLVCIVGLGYGGQRFRFRSLLTRQKDLERRVADATARLRHEATHDRLTGLLNRAEVESRLAAALNGACVDEGALIALLDIDHFKAINDRHGHLAGDDVLRALGALVGKALRQNEYAGRYGGEEVLLVLEDRDGNAGERVLALHRLLRQERVVGGGREIDVTCSIGLAWARAGDNWETLIGRADEALYDAKRSGRDRVMESRRVPRRRISVGSNGGGE